MPEVWIPPRLQELTNGKQQVQVSGATVRQVINDLDAQFPGMKDELCLDGDLYPGLAVIVDGETANLGLLERVQENSEIHFLPAISDG